MPVLTNLVEAFIEESQQRALDRGEIKIPPDLNAAMGYEPRFLQDLITQNERRFNVEVVHRRFGKTVMKVAKLIRRAIECPYPDGRYAYMAPTYSQAEDIAWTYLVQFATSLLNACGIEDTSGWINNSKLTVFLPTRLGSSSRIRVYGVDSPKQRIRGMYLDGVVMDEAAWFPQSVWTEQVRPMLSDENRAGVDFPGYTNQWCDFIFTPAGRNQSYRMLKRAQRWHAGLAVSVIDPETGQEYSTTSDEWYACVMPASKTGVLSKEELNRCRIEMGREAYEQEFEVSFDAIIRGAIFGPELKHIRALGQIGKYPYNDMFPVYTSWDLGWDDSTAIWFVQWISRDVYRVIDYYEASGQDLAHYAQVLSERGYRYRIHFFPHDVNVHELGTGKSRASILRDLGVRVTVVPKHYVQDGLSAVQALLPYCQFDEGACAEGLDRLQLYRREFNDRTGVFKGDPLHDWTSHAADAFRIFAMGVSRDSTNWGPYGYRHRRPRQPQQAETGR